MVKAVILAGGLGTRISEETMNRPKPMVTIGGKPLRCPQAIPMGHKVAIERIPAGAKVLKYGAPIGSATCRPSSPAGNSSGLRSPARWSRDRR